MARYTDYERKLRSRYTKVRRGVMQQAKRLDVKYPGSGLLEQYKTEFPTLKEIGKVSLSGLQHITRQASGVYHSKVLTQQGYRESLEHTVATMRADPDEGGLGFDFVTMDNVISVIKFMDDLRARGVATFRPSFALLEAYERIRKKQLTSQEVENLIKTWEADAEKYQSRKEWAAKRGRPAPEPGRLRISRKRYSGND